MEIQPHSAESPDNLRALAYYRKPYRRVAVPTHRMASHTLANVAADALFPWEHTGEYPGRIRGLVALFHGRVTKWAIREWRRGRNPTPQWAYDLVLTELHKRRAALDHAIALIEAHNKKAPD